MEERKVFLALVSNKIVVSVYVYYKQGKTLKTQVFSSSSFIGYVLMFVIWSFLISSFSESQ